jgi:hypothetical protein
MITLGTLVQASIEPRFGGSLVLDVLDISLAGLPLGRG